MQNQTKSFNETYVPKTLSRKTQIKNINPLLQKNSYDKTYGNVYVELDPPQIKFNGYEINKINSLTFKIINKAPVSQRFNIIPPLESHFSIKVNKKGSIPTGMFETVQVSFKATQYKYIYDVVKINTETENFVVPLYAYPTIPNLHTIFPKAIDFGNIELKQTESFFYPIKNPTPIDYKFDFMYKKECAEIMINPLNGTIPGNGEVIVEMAFIPNRKITYSAEVYFKIQQFDFQPLFIQLVGSGKQKDLSKTFKRLKSSKLVPLKEKQEQSQKLQKQRMNQTETNLNDKAKELKKSFQTNIRKIGLKATYPKLLSSTMKQNSPIKGPTGGATLQQIVNQKLIATTPQIKNPEQRQFLSRFNKIQELDKEKQIKFSQYLGDRALTQNQLQFQRQIIQQMNNFRTSLLKNQCQSRYNPQLTESTQVQYAKLKQPLMTWNQNRNDFIYERRNILNKFVIAASKVIESRRMLKRLDKVKIFLADCTTKEEVAKKVEQSYQKSLDSHSSDAFKEQINLMFDTSFIEPTYMELQFVEGKEKFNERTFETEGKPEFDDLSTLALIQPYESQKMYYNQINFPADFVDLNRVIPAQRVSGEEQFSVKSSSVPNIEPIELLANLKKPFQIPNHYFIHQEEHIALFKEYNAIDEKSSIYLFSNKDTIQDEFQGWSKGDMQILKAKLLKNTGVDYSSFSAFNFSPYRNDIGFVGEITKNLPQFIQKAEDEISDDDSDDEKYQQGKVQGVDEFIDKIQVNPQVKTRRQKKQIQNQDQRRRDRVDRNLQKDKYKKVTKYIQKSKNLNKVIQNPSNYFVL